MVHCLLGPLSISRRRSSSSLGSRTKQRRARKIRSKTLSTARCGHAFAAQRASWVMVRPRHRLLICCSAYCCDAAVYVVARRIKALRPNMMRSVLTALGVIVGVSAVICTVAVGENASFKIREAIASTGDNVVWVEAGGVNRLATASHRDISNASRA